MATWNSRGLRGSTLEELINLSNEKYADGKMGLIQKIPTPIKPIRLDKDTGQITLGYFDQKSTVDYIGVVQGVPVCFDAKECHTDTFPLQNIHPHQITFMQKFEDQDGIAFLVIYYTHRDEMYYLPFSLLYSFFERMKQGGRKSFRFDEIDTNYKIRSHNGIPVHYLEPLSLDLQNR